MKMGLFKKWKRKRRLKNILNEINVDPFYKLLKNFHEDLPDFSRISINDIQFREFKATIKVTSVKDKFKEYRNEVKTEVPIEEKPRVVETKKETIPKPREPTRTTPHSGGMYDATFKIVLFGDAGTPKTELTQRFLTNLFVSDSKMTIGVDFEVKSLIVDENKVKLQIWDFGGEERFRFLLPTYVRGAKGGIFVYDITNYSSLAHIDDWLTVIRKEIKPEDSFPIIVVGGNADLNESREVSAEDGIKIAKSRGVDSFIECSARTGENVEEAFDALTRLMLTNSHDFKIS